MIDDYLAAKRLGDAAYRKALVLGQYPFLSALDDMIRPEDIAAENRLGTMEIPIEDIVGTKTRGRQESFASNFMPILGPKTEFAGKWSSLYDAAVSEGIRDPILVYEYMNRFYVQEGNKRVSVSKYNGAVSIAASVVRLMPVRDDTKENKIYYEFVEFFKVSGIYGISFSMEGQYRRLCELIGQSQTEPWDTEARQNLKAAFDRFTDVFKKKGGDGLKELTLGDAFLIYIKIYGLDALLNVSNTAIEQNLSKIWNEFKKGASDISLVENPGIFRKSSGIFDIFNPGDKGFTGKTLEIAFIYEKNTEISSWTFQHELGRNYIDGIFKDRIHTVTYPDCQTPEKAAAAIDEAVEKGADLVFTTSSMMVDVSVQAAVKYPKLRILNCSVNTAYNTIRTYYARMYEAKFLMGALAASMEEGDDVGYVEAFPQYGTLASINAFAIGAQLVNPRTRVHLKWSQLHDRAWQEEFLTEGIHTISGPELTPPKMISREFGVYQVTADGQVQNLATPVFDWGKFYEIIIRSVFDGSFDRADKSNAAQNLWFGLSSGVIDIIMSNTVPYTVKKLIHILRHGILYGRISPFDGELHSREGLIKDENSLRLSAEDIVSMRWLNDNVLGRIPKLEEFNDTARELMQISGFMESSN